MRSFFQRENEPAPRAPSPSPSPAAPKTSRGVARETTRIARGSTVVGEISGTAELLIEGRVEGEIELRNRVVVSRLGEVEGKIIGAAVEVAGKVVGNVQGVERVQVLESGKLEGDVISPRVVIAEGAFFKGKVEMSSAAGKSQRTPKPSASRGPLDRPPGSAGGVAAAPPTAQSRAGKTNS